MLVVGRAFLLSPVSGGYLHSVGYMNVDAAIEEIQQVRPIIDPSKILWSSVKENLG